MTEIETAGVYDALGQGHVAKLNLGAWVVLGDPVEMGLLLGGAEVPKDDGFVAEGADHRLDKEGGDMV